MRRVQQYIAVVFVWLIGLSLLPYNALHLHEESQHLASLLNSKEVAHHCDLDTHQCQGEFNKHCQHQQHVSKQVAKCFTCQFHFIKGYIAVAQHNLKTQLETRDLFLTFHFYPKGLHFINIENKGPPHLA